MVIEQTDRDELVELMGRYANMPDTKNWDELPRSVFCDEFTAGFSSLGAPVTTTSRDAWCQQSRMAQEGVCQRPPAPAAAFMPGDHKCSTHLRTRISVTRAPPPANAGCVGWVLDHIAG
jgi:hypothetical protein